MRTFADLGVSAPVCRALTRRNLRNPFTIQTLVIPDALRGRDVLAKSQTGSGKTIAFAVPIVERLERRGTHPRALVLVPTRELALQVTEELASLCAARGLRVAAVYGGASLSDQARRAAKADVLVATPGRLQDLMGRRLVSVDSITILVLDEADRMLDMGFQPQVDRIVRNLTRDRQTMLFSATLDGGVGFIARAYTRDPVRHEVAEQRQTVAEASHRFVPVTEEGKTDTLIELLSEDRGLALVFVRTKRGADRLAVRLEKRGLAVLTLHGDMAQAARKRAIDRFGSGRIDVLVATDVAARGLDLDHITHVVNYDPPEDHKDYVHRVGRTARAGRSGTGVTLVLARQQADVSQVASRLDLRSEFEAEGLTLAKPRTLYSSHGSRSMLRSRPKRR